MYIYAELLQKKCILLLHHIHTIHGVSQTVIKATRVGQVGEIGEGAVVFLYYGYAAAIAKARDIILYE